MKKRGRRRDFPAMNDMLKKFPPEQQATQNKRAGWEHPLSTGPNFNCYGQNKLQTITILIRREVQGKILLP
jgi:hypothetical protein